MPEANWLPPASVPTTARSAAKGNGSSKAPTSSHWSRRAPARKTVMQILHVAPDKLVVVKKR